MQLFARQVSALVPLFAEIDQPETPDDAKETLTTRRTSLGLDKDEPPFIEDLSPENIQVGTLPDIGIVYPHSFGRNCNLTILLNFTPCVCTINSLFEHYVFGSRKIKMF